jgi:hypothetical protein
MSDEMPDYTPRQQPPERKGLSTGCLVSLVVVAIILLVFGLCVGVFSTMGA